MVKTYCEICNQNFKSEEAIAMHNNAKHKHPEQIEKKSSYKGLFIFMGVFIIAAVLIFFMAGRTTGNVVNAGDTGTPAPSGDVQKVTLSFKDYTYYPRTITVKEGIPVEITLDSSIGGCFRTLVIRDLGVRQSSSNPADKIKFTPNKKGSFEFACGMHMATGTIVVE